MKIGAGDWPIARQSINGTAVRIKTAYQRLRQFPAYAFRADVPCSYRRKINEMRSHFIKPT